MKTKNSENQKIKTESSSAFCFLPSIFYLILLSAFCFLLSPAPTLAAELNLTSQTQEIGINQQFQVDLLLDTENEEINAVEGKIIFPSELLELKEIKDGDSIINFWVERPVRVVSCSVSCELAFSGIIPGGFSGVFSPFYENVKPGKILSLIFQTKKEGEGAIEINEAKVLLNDGKGTPTKTTIFNFQFSIFKEVQPTPTIVEIVKDTDSPEDFKPEVASDPNIFEGQWFLVFASQDKNSGISHYEILEKAPRQYLFNKFWQKEKWVTAESPYLLKDQKLKSHLSVKAIDKAGNERTVTLPPSKPLAWYEQSLVWIIIILGLGVAYLVRKILWRIYTKQH